MAVPNGLGDPGQSLAKVAHVSVVHEGEQVIASGVACHAEFAPGDEEIAASGLPVPDLMNRGEPSAARLSTSYPCSSGAVRRAVRPSEVSARSTAATAASRLDGP